MKELLSKSAQLIKIIIGNLHIQVKEWDLNLNYDVQPLIILLHTLQQKLVKFVNHVNAEDTYFFQPYEFLMNHGRILKYEISNMFWMASWFFF